MKYDNIEFGILKGKTLKEIRIGTDVLIFVVSDKEQYIMHHRQDCCESVVIEDICGDLQWLLDSPILKAEMRTNTNEPHRTVYSDSSNTWTFYEIATLKGSVTIRWYGSSNGYYSEEVDFERVDTND